MKKCTHTTNKQPNQSPSDDDRALAEKRWGERAIVLPGNGPFAVVTQCDAVIISLHATYRQALDVLDMLNECGCSRTKARRCRFNYKGDNRWRHQIVDLLAPPFTRWGGCDIWVDPSDLCWWLEGAA